MLKYIIDELGWPGSSFIVDGEHNLLSSIIINNFNDGLDYMINQHEYNSFFNSEENKVSSERIAQKEQNMLQHYGNLFGPRFQDYT